MPYSRQENPEGNSIKISKKRTLWRWFWRGSLIFIILFLIFAFCLNGPLGRYIIKDQIQKAAASNGLEGDFELSGSIIDGYKLSNIDFTGNQGIQAFKAESISIDYNLQDLADKKIEAVELKSLSLTIDIDKFPKTKDEDKEQKSLKETLAEIRPFAIQPNFKLTDLDVNILKSEKSLTSFQLEKFEHTTDSDEFKFHSLAIQSGEEIDTAPQDVTIQWKENSALIDRLEVLPQIGVKNTSIDWENDILGSSEIFVHEANFKASYHDDISLELQSGSLSSAKLSEQFDIELPAEFTLNKLKVDIANSSAPDFSTPIPDWNIDADIGLVDAKYEEYDLSKTSLSIQQKEGSYKSTLVTTLWSTPINLDLAGSWDQPNEKEWWAHTSLHYNLTIPKFNDLLSHWMEPIEKLNFKQTALTASGDSKIVDFNPSSISTDLKLSGTTLDDKTLPTVTLKGNLLDKLTTIQFALSESNKDILTADGTYHLESKSYDGAVKTNISKPELINSISSLLEQDFTLASGLHFKWKGNGKIEEQIEDSLHKGDLSLAPLSFHLPDTPKLTVSTETTYLWPEKIDISMLSIQEQDWSAVTTLAWDGKTVSIPTLDLTHENAAVANLSGSIPFTPSIQSAQDYFSQKENWTLDILTKEIPLTKIEKWSGQSIPEEVTGKAQTSLKLSGSPNNPSLNGFAKLINIRGLNPNLQEDINAELNFKSATESLLVECSVIEGEAQRLAANGVLPFTPLAWIEEPETLQSEMMDAPLSGEADILTFPLSRISPFVPQLEKITGSLSATGTFSGTINKPEYKLDVTAEVPLLKLQESEIGTVRQIKLDSTVTNDLIINNKLSAQINGGKFEITGDIDVNNPEDPTFDASLVFSHALVYRDDDLSTRANGDISLKGKIDDATISGTISVVESLFYKDIELVPIGVPSSAVSQVNLPATSTGSEELPIPEPFSSWNLDLTIKTQDPILIRGNIAQGQVEGSIKLGGKLKQPEPRGKFYVKDVTAKLPFSKLNIDNGEVIFTPQTGIMNPNLKVLGKSRVGDYDINLLVYGSTSSPKTSLSSSPPLPEAEIMSLLGTGSTTSALASGDAVALKGLQLFLQKMQQRQTTPAGKQVYETLLNSMDKLDLQVGQIDPFTGREFTSASLDFTPNWLFTTQIDEDKNTRGLLVYLIRFK